MINIFINILKNKGCHTCRGNILKLTLKFTVRKMTFITDTSTLRVMMNEFDSIVRPTIDVQRAEN